jgi:serine/threonine protein kinase
VNGTLKCPRCENPRLPEGRFCQRCGHRFSEAVVDQLLGVVLLGRYRVVRLLGEGTMGKVYLGEQHVGESLRNVAIKVLSVARGTNDYIIARFRREASTVASLEHPNIIRLYDYGEENGRFFSVMEYVPGGSLAQLIARGRVAPERVEYIVAQIASALDAAHRRGIVHRDLKPENVLLANALDAPTGSDSVKVVDFGIARRPPQSPTEQPLTISGAMMGTPAFMAPEQFMGETADARADEYALALVAYQLLSGTLPWRAETVSEWASAHLNQAPPSVRAQFGCEALPQRMDHAISVALAKSPHQRFPGALAFASAFCGRSLDTGNGGPLPVVRGAAPVEEIVIPVRRTPVWAFVIAAVVALTAVTSVVVWLQNKAEPVVTPITTPNGAADAAIDARSSQTEDIQNRLNHGMENVRHEHLDVALTDLESLTQDPTVTPSTREPLRNAVARLAETQFHRIATTQFNARTSCEPLRVLLRRLTVVRADTQARTHLPSRCRTPGGILHLFTPSPCTDNFCNMLQIWSLVGGEGIVRQRDPTKAVNTVIFHSNPVSSSNKRYYKFPLILWHATCEAGLYSKCNTLCPWL